MRSIYKDVFVPIKILLDCALMFKAKGHNLCVTLFTSKLISFNACSISS